MIKQTQLKICDTHFICSKCLFILSITLGNWLFGCRWLSTDCRNNINKTFFYGHPLGDSSAAMNLGFSLCEM